MIIDSLKTTAEKIVSDSTTLLTDQTSFGTPLSRLLILAGIILLASILYLAYHRWIVPTKIQQTDEYKKNKYKDIDGC